MVAVHEARRNEKARVICGTIVRDMLTGHQYGHAECIITCIPVQLFAPPKYVYARSFGKLTPQSTDPLGIRLSQLSNLRVACAPEPATSESFSMPPSNLRITVSIIQ